MHAIEQGKYLVWAGGKEDAAKGAFIWALYPIDSSHTRLISRIRWTHNWSKPGLLPLDLFTEFTDHLAVRKILTGIKVRAEGGKINSMAIQSIPFFIYIAILLSIHNNDSSSIFKATKQKNFPILPGCGACLACYLVLYASGMGREYLEYKNGEISIAN